MKTFKVYYIFAFLALAGCTEKDWQAMMVHESDKTDQKTEQAAEDQNNIDENPPATEKAMFGAGCFWGVQLRFDKIDGVIKTEVGYSGGNLENPTYKQVCTDKTGHAEALLIEYDPRKVTYDQLLHVFWRCHDPTQVNRQGPDYGTQYRSVVFYFDEKQKQAALESKAELEKYRKFKGKIATVIEPAQIFWPAEDYHQKYLEKRGKTACHIPAIWNQ